MGWKVEKGLEGGRLRKQRIIKTDGVRGMWVCGVGRGEGSEGGKKVSSDRLWGTRVEGGRVDAVRHTKMMGGKPGDWGGHEGSEE